jgi:hypothetical protein
MTIDDYNPLLADEHLGPRIRDLIIERINTLTPAERERVARAEVGSTELVRTDNGWIHVYIGIADPVDLGSFSLTALAKDATPGDPN